MDTLDHKNALAKLNDNDLKDIDGGGPLSGTLINAFTSGMKFVLELGRSFGSALRRIKEGKMCEVS